MRKLQNNELSRLTVSEFRETEKIPCIVVLDNVRSLNNIGSVFRTSDAFLIEAVYLCGITATPPHRDIHKTALGATDTVKWEYFLETSQAIKKLKTDGFRIYAVEQVENSLPLMKFQDEECDKAALVFGHEVKGVDQEIVNMSDACLEIPQYGTKHSLNISVCAGIVLWEVYKKFVKNQ